MIVPQSRMPALNAGFVRESFQTCPTIGVGLHARALSSHGNSSVRGTSMSRYSFTLVRAAAVCLMVAGIVPVTWAQPQSLAKLQATPVITLAQRDTPGVPRGAVCINWVDAGHGKRKCRSWCFPRPGYSCQ